MKVSPAEYERMRSMLNELKAQVYLLSNMLEEAEIEGVSDTQNKGRTPVAPSTGIQTGPSIPTYGYCRLEFKGCKNILSYRIPEGMNIQPGDVVMAPFGRKNVLRHGTVIFVGTYFDYNVPYPLDETKFIDSVC